MCKMESDGEKTLIKIQQMRHRTNSRGFASIKQAVLTTMGD